VNDRPKVTIWSPVNFAVVGAGSVPVWFTVEEDDPGDVLTSIELNVPGFTAECYERTRSDLREALGLDIDARAYRECLVDFSKWPSTVQENRIEGQIIQALATDGHQTTGSISIQVTVDRCESDLEAGLFDDSCADHDGDGITKGRDCDDNDPNNTYIKGRDTDKDGVPDCEDVCPTMEAKGAKEYQG